MWIFCKPGFFSVVQADGGEKLMVRARVREDLDRLREGYAPELSETVATATTDYPYRAFISHEAFAKALARAAVDIDYRNFKDMVERTLGLARHLLYARVWQVMYGAEETLRLLARERRRGR